MDLRVTEFKLQIVTSLLDMCQHQLKITWSLYEGTFQSCLAVTLNMVQLLFFFKWQKKNKEQTLLLPIAITLSCINCDWGNEKIYTFKKTQKKQNFKWNKLFMKPSLWCLILLKISLKFVWKSGAVLLFFLSFINGKEQPKNWLMDF